MPTRSEAPSSAERLELHRDHLRRGNIRFYVNGALVGSQAATGADRHLDEPTGSAATRSSASTSTG